MNRLPITTLIISILLLAAPRPALAWGPAMHAYVVYKAREEAGAKGVDWRGLDLHAYIAAAPAPDLWYAAEEAKLTVPGSIEEDWEYVRLMFAESKNIRQISFTLGYAGHIEGDVRGHVVYLAAGTGNQIHHLVRDTCSGFVLFGAHEGYSHHKMPLDLVVGWGLDTIKGAGTQSGEWKWTAFDDELVSLMKRTADRWCDGKSKKTGGKVKGCPVSSATIKKLRDFQRFAVNTVAHSLSFPGYYAEQTTTVKNAKLVKSYDDTEFGPGKGPAKLKEALEGSTSETARKLFIESDVRTWINKAGASSAELDRFFNGPPPHGQDELEGIVPDAGCALAGPPCPGWWPLLLLLILRRYAST